MKKALALLSGGLDSSLAAWLVKKQGILVEGLIFKSYFFGPEKGIAAAKQLKIPYQIIDFSKKHLRIIKKPRHGYGKAANPCLDCHILMLKETKKILEKKKFDFVITGEVLGQRPFSQNKQALLLIANKSGLSDRLLRPLSAKLLPVTLPEKKKLINRKKLLAIKGRSRKEQIKLAQKIHLKFLQPAGGCILTEKEFAKKLFELQEKKPRFNGSDIALLKIGRHFWQAATKIIIGRSKQENEILEKLALPKDILIEPANFAGPSALIRGKKIGQENIIKAKKLIKKYSKLKKIPPKIVFFGSNQESVETLKTLLNSKAPIKLVITQPDRPSGRGQKPTPTALAEFCQKKQIKILKWTKLNADSLEKTQKKLKTKLPLGIVSVYGNLIPKIWLEWCGMILVLHPSLLPRWRWSAPVIKTILSENRFGGISIIKLDPKKMDAGPIIIQKKTKIKTNETTGELTQRLFKKGNKELVAILEKTIYSKNPSFWLMKAQNHSRATFAPRFDKSEAEINWLKSPEKILNQIRAFNPFPGAYTLVKIKNKKMRFKIWRGHLENGKLILDEVQLEGKNRVSWQQFKTAYPTTKLPAPEK